jgi:acetyl esterase/lipase
MPPSRIRCPDCGELAERLESRPKRKKIRCQECGRVFTPRDVENGEDEEERPRRRKRKSWSTATIVLAILGGCALFVVLVCGGGIWLAVHRALQPTSFPPQTEDYAEARKHFQTRLVRQGPAPQDGGPAPPPPGVEEVGYRSGSLNLKSWVNRKPGARQQPGVLFLHGGFAFDLDDWEQAQPFRDAGFVVMTPILRGENMQPGNYTMFYDEVNDVLNAAEALSRLTEIDSRRLFVAGHSVGGTLALLSAQSSNRFKAAAAFSGSPDQIAWLRGQEELAPFARNDPREMQMRSPLAFPQSFKCPTRIYFGSAEILFRPSSELLARKAKENGLDVEAASVPGDHMTAVPEAMRRCIAFFKQH